MRKNREQLLESLDQLVEGCKAYPEAGLWVRWFSKDRRALQSALENNDTARERIVLADIAQALMGGMGAFCDGAAPDKKLEVLGNRTYRLVSRIRRK